MLLAVQVLLFLFALLRILRAAFTNYPFEKFGWIVDVGGGNASLRLRVLERHPVMRAPDCSSRAF